MNKDFLQRLLPVFLFIIAATLFINNGSISLWDQDESAYGGFAYNMIENGQWLIPDFMWSDVHRKPPLHFWNIAWSYKIFGVGEFAIRFPSALAILLTLLSLYLGRKTLWDRQTALTGAVVLGTTFLVMALAKVSVTDATLLFFSTLCGLAILQVLKKPQTKWIITFWASFALALLTKGPPVIIFTSALAAILFILHPERKNLLKFHPWFFLPLAIAPLLIWGYLTTLQDGGKFVDWLIDWYILKRVSGQVFGQTGPPGMQLLGILLFFIPYLMFLPKALWKAIKGIFRKERDYLLLGAWFIASWLPYELTPSKLPAYVLVAHVPLAILVAKEIISHFRNHTRPHLAWIVIHFIMLTALPAAMLLAPQFVNFLEAYDIRFYLVGFGIGFLCFLVLLLVQIRKKIFIPLLLTYNVLFQLLMWGILMPNVDHLKNATQRTAEFIAMETPKNSSILIGNVFGRPPSLPFYLREFKEVREVQSNEVFLAAYLSKEPHVLILNKEQFIALRQKIPSAEYHLINSFMVARDGRANYYVVRNTRIRQ